MHETSVQVPSGKDGKDGKDGVNGQNGKNGAEGKSAYQVAVDNGYIGTEAQWLQSLKGDTGNVGATGATGAEGKSAYQVAVDNGFKGSESEWLASLKGEKITYDDFTAEDKASINNQAIAAATKAAADAITDTSIVVEGNEVLFNI